MLATLVRVIGVTVIAQLKGLCNLVFVALSYVRARLATGGVSVRPSHARNASKLMTVGSRSFHRRVAQGL